MISYSRSPTQPDSWSMLAAPTGRMSEVAVCPVCVPVSGPTTNLTVVFTPGSSSTGASDWPPKRFTPVSNH